MSCSINETGCLEKTKSNINSTINTTKILQDFQLNTPLYETLKITLKKSKNVTSFPLNLTDSLLSNFCRITAEEQIVIDYRIFKYIAKTNTYDMLIDHIINTIDYALTLKPVFTIHIYAKLLTIAAADNHVSFVYKLTDILNKKYPEKLNKCYIYEAPYIFQQILLMLSMFVDKRTIAKINVIE